MENSREALHLARLFAKPLSAGRIRIVKVGSRLFTACGPSLLSRLASYVPQIFLDLKFHDIPQTVAGAVRIAATLPGVKMLTIHASGGEAMMRASREALGDRPSPKLLAVTILTSTDAATLRQMGIAGTPQERVLQLAKLAREAEMDGVIASPLEIGAVRKACGPDFLIVVPGIRPKTSLTGDDQKRVATPSAALRAGADYLVVGRPILDASDPAKAADAILREMAAAKPVRGERDNPA